MGYDAISNARLSAFAKDSVRKKKVNILWFDWGVHLLVFKKRIIFLTICFLGFCFQRLFL